ncbi:MAG: diacylglycerol kinase family protein [Saprospiraceae bacterium]
MIKERLQSFKFALKGIRLLFLSETNAKIHLAFTFLVIAGGLFFSVSWTEWCLLVLAIAMVLCAEGMNTAIEYLTDLVSPNFHELAGKTKDVAAGAVLIAAIGAAIIGCMIFLPKIWDYFCS